MVTRKRIRRPGKPQMPYGPVIFMGEVMTHRTAVRVAHEMFRDGERCPRCRRPMRYWQKLDLGHVVAKMFGGGPSPVRLEHAACNRSAGAKLGNATRKSAAQAAVLRTAARRATPVKRKWAA